MDTQVLVKQAFGLLHVNNFRDLSRKYSEEDQRLMHAQAWNADNPQLIVNQIKTLLEQLDPAELDDEEREWWQEILWFWHHHAISWAIWKKKDRTLAQFHATKALEIQPKPHPNVTTRLLYLLVHDQAEEAEEWTRTNADGVERETAHHLIESYRRNEFFA